MVQKLKQFSYLGTLILCVLLAIFPLTINFFGGGDGLVSTGSGGAIVGGLGARFGFPCESFGLSERSDVERDDEGVGVVGADARDVMLPPENSILFKNFRILLFMLSFDDVHLQIILIARSTPTIFVYLATPF